MASITLSQHGTPQSKLSASFIKLFGNCYLLCSRVRFSENIILLLKLKTILLIQSVYNVFFLGIGSYEKHWSSCMLLT